MDQENTDVEAPARSHAGVCPNGHEVPAWRSTCGVCDLEPLPIAGRHPIGEPPSPSNDPRSASKFVWVVLAALAIGAIAMPLARGDEHLIEDDFTTPEALRTWPEDGAVLSYADGAYQVAVLSDDRGAWAYQELPRAVTGMTITVHVETSEGQPVPILDCIAETKETEVPGSTNTSVEVVTGYSFLVLPNDRYVITRMDEVLSSGAMAWDGSGTITAGCVGVGSGAANLTLRVDDGGTVDVTDPRGLDTFMAVGLGAYAKQGGGVLLYDDLEVSEAS